MALSDIIQGVSTLGKETPASGTHCWTIPPRGLMNLYNVYYKVLCDGIQNYKYITIRPHDHLVCGMYGTTGHKNLINLFKDDLLNLIRCPFIGSVESNNSKFIHFHLILKCSRKQYETIRSNLINKYCLLEKAMKKKQYAIKQDKLEDERIRLFNLYRLGYSVYKGQRKESHICLITNDKTLLDNVSQPITLDNYEYLQALEEYAIEKIRINKQRKNCKNAVGII